MDKPVKKVKPPSDRAYRQAEIQIAFDFAPRIYACQKCGWPVASGYCCNICGDNNPYEPAKKGKK